MIIVRRSSGNNFFADFALFWTGFDYSYPSPGPPAGTPYNVAHLPTEMDATHFETIRNRPAGARHSTAAAAGYIGTYLNRL